MIKRVFLALSCFALAVSVPFDSVGQSRAVNIRASASIGVTAHVVAAGGMTPANEAALTLAEKTLRPNSGSPLFWIYHPRPGRVQVEVSSSSGYANSADYRNIDGGNLGPIAQYSYASLVEVKAVPVANDPITVTLIYPDN